jgi:hypothetical protein
VVRFVNIQRRLELDRSEFKFFTYLRKIIRKHEITKTA